MIRAQHGVGGKVEGLRQQRMTGAREAGDVQRVEHRPSTLVPRVERPDGNVQHETARAEDVHGVVKSGLTLQGLLGQLRRGSVLPLEHGPRQVSRGSPRRIVHEDAVGIDADRHDVVIALRALFDEQHRRALRVEFDAQRGRGAGQAGRRPVPFTQRLDEDGVGDAACGVVDQRRELAHGGMRIAPVAEQHNCGCTAAERFGLRQVRDVEHQPSGVRGLSGRRR